jgi:nucleotide-binding universal stress UspA family protein
MVECVRTILVPVDFEPASASAVKVAAEIAKQCGSTVRLLHAESVEAPPYFTHEQIDALEAERRATRAQAEQYLRQFGSQYLDGPFVSLVDDRSPVDAILEESAGVDLVVMGTHGRSGPTRWWLGSVAERVLRGVATPLLVVRAAAPVDAGLFRRAVLHAAGGPRNGAAALAYAAGLVEEFGGTVEDARQRPVDAVLADEGVTLLVVDTPSDRSHHWLASYGERVVRSARAPILFVPERPEGGSHDR